MRAQPTNGRERSRAPSIALLRVALVSTALAAACGQESRIFDGASDAGAGAGGAQSTSGEGGGFIIDAGDDGSLAGCATSTAKAELLPLDMYIMLDQSGSMLGPKWSAITQAIGAFVAEPTLANLGVGLQYFPLELAKVCDYKAYAVPEIPIAPLSLDGPSIVQSLSKHTPNGDTPTLPALQGATSYAKGWIAMNPTHSTVVVLATDGEPDVCGSTIDNVTQAAQVGFNTSPPVRTFVIGVGKALTGLDQIAAAGGTTTAVLVDDASQATTQEFVDALNAIRGTALPCEYAIPLPDGGAIDYGFVNVLYTPGAGKGAVIPQVTDAKACANVAQGWYYDDPANPTKVIVCAGLCTTLKADASGKVDLVFGCQTEVAK